MNLVLIRLLMVYWKEFSSKISLLVHMEIDKCFCYTFKGERTAFFVGKMKSRCHGIMLRI